MHRRTFIATAGAVTAASIAGCSDEADPTDGDGGDEDGQTGESSDSTPTPTERGDSGSESTSTETTTDSPTETETETRQTATVPVGEVVAGEQMSMVVQEVTKQTEIGDFQEADSGNTFAVVRLAVKNTTDSTFIGFSGFLQTQIKDAEDYTYDQTIAVTGQTFQGGQLAPGEVSRGDLVYEIPEDASGLTLQFDFQAFSFLNFERVNVDLTETASSIADLSQDLNVDIHGTGDEVTYEDVSVTVNGVEYAETIGSFAEADSGNQFAIVDITTTNDTDEELRISTLLQMKMKDGIGSSYNISISALSALDRAYNESQPLAAGESRRGKVPYEVPKDADPLYWIFEFNLWVDGDKTFWEV